MTPGAAGRREDVNGTEEVVWLDVKTKVGYVDAACNTLLWYKGMWVEDGKFL
jgi:hypothetical protein